MTKTLKPGDKLNYEGKQWTVTQIGEDNEGQVVFHLKSGDALSVIKESHLLNEVGSGSKRKSSK